MSETHVIRLRGPWEYEPLARVFLGSDGTRNEGTDDLPPPGRLQLPADWGATLGRDFHGRVRYRRRFGLPTNLGPLDEIWLVIEGVDYFGDVSLNGQALGRIAGYVAPREFDIRGALAPRNLLTLDVELPRYAMDSGAVATIERPGRDGLPGGPIGEVRLEIRATR